MAFYACTSAVTICYELPCWRGKTIMMTVTQTANLPQIVNITTYIFLKLDKYLEIIETRLHVFSLYFNTTLFLPAVFQLSSVDSEILLFVAHCLTIFAKKLLNIVL